MDTISPEFRFDMDVDSTWQIHEWSYDEDQGFMFHHPTRSLFAVYLAEGVEKGQAELPDLRARLIHVCSSSTPSYLNLLAQKAMNAFGAFSDDIMSWCDEEIPF